MIKVICENEIGQRLTMSQTRASPLFLASISGTRDSRHILSTAKAAGQDGVTVTGSTGEERNIVLSIQIKADYSRYRNILTEFFQPNETGTLFYYEGEIARKIKYTTEEVTSEETGVIRTTTISLICGNPLFEDIQETRVPLSAWRGCIKFPLRIHNPFKVTEKINTLMQNIYSPTNTVAGLRIRFEASGEVINPSIVDVMRHKILTLGLTLHAGDALEITTGKLAKNAVLLHNGVRSNVINTIAYPPQWPQIYKGDNLFRYDAVSGIDVLSVTIFYTQTYWGC